jgi:hypothetical protein
VLLVHPFGKAQGLTVRLPERGFAVRAHPRIHRVLYPLRGAGVPVGPTRRFDGSLGSSEVLLWPLPPPTDPPGLRRKKIRLALVSGRAADEREVTAFGCDRGFTLSDLADFESLVAYVGGCRPKRVILLSDPGHRLSCPSSSRGMPRVQGRRRTEKLL